MSGHAGLGEAVVLEKMDVVGLIGSESKLPGEISGMHERAGLALLLFVDQTTTSTRLDGPKVDLNRVRMTLSRTGGQWLVSGVDAL